MSWKIAPIGRDGDLLYSQAGTPSLDLRFAEKKALTDYVSGDNLVTFSRSSSGTYVGSDGLIKTSPVNLLTYSEDLDNAAWNKNNGSVSANVDTSPIGDQTADKWIPNTTDNFHFLKAPLTGGSTEVFTYSIYAKQSGYRYLLVNTSSGSSAGNAGPVVDLQDGVVVNNYTVTYPVTVTDAGNGWWRIVLTFTGSGAIIAIDHNPFPTSTVATYEGDGTSGILLWGAQIEEGTTATDYIPTTSSPGGAPRFDHDPTTGESLGLLVEESRTNSLKYSAGFDQSSWTTITGGTGSAAVVTSGYTAPDGSLTAFRLQCNLNGGTTSNDKSSLNQSLTGLSNPHTSTISIYVKSNTGSDQALYFRNAQGTGGDGLTATSEWQRFSISGTVTDTIDNFQLGARGTLSDDVIDVLIWGAQFEIGSFPTSYIPTSGATATRAADVAEITGANFSSWYNQSEGTVYVDRTYSTNSTGHSYYFSDSSITANRVRLQLITHSGNNADGSTLNLPASGNKSALAVKTNDVAVSADGSSVSSDTTFTLAPMDRLFIGKHPTVVSELNGHIKRLSYFPVRLPDATLQTITT